jgi:hypothetical protein
MIPNLENHHRNAVATHPKLDNHHTNNMAMKIIFTILLALTGMLHAAFAQFETKLRKDLYVSKLSDSVYVVTHYFP